MKSLNLKIGNTQLRAIPKAKAKGKWDVVIVKTESEHSRISTRYEGGKKDILTSIEKLLS